jgi:hypothetical protein
MKGQLELMRLIPLALLVGAPTYALILWLKPQILVRRQILQPLFEMSVVGHLKGLLVRLPHITVLLVWHFFSLRMFGVKVNPLQALLYLPATFAVSSIPGASVNGLGLPQVVCLFFFTPYADGATEEARKAQVFAYTLAVSGISIILQLVLGFACLRRATAIGLSTRVEQPTA